MSKVIANMSVSLDGFIEPVSVLLGSGKPWLAGVGSHVHPENPVITPGGGVTHLVYHVHREG